MYDQLITRLCAGNHKYVSESDTVLRELTAKHGQSPYAILVCCSDSRVIPEKIFQADIGDLFTIRVAGNVLDRHQLGSIEYAAAHLGTKLIVVLGHTNCGAIQAALTGESDGFIRYITDEIHLAIGSETNPKRACHLNILHAVKRIREELSHHPEIEGVSVVGAVYDVFAGTVEWLQYSLSSEL